MRRSLVLLAVGARRGRAVTRGGRPAGGRPGLPPTAQPRVDTSEVHSHEDHVDHDALDEARLRSQTELATAVDAGRRCCRSVCRLTSSVRGGRSRPGPSSPSTRRCCRTARSSPTTPSATGRRRPSPRTTSRGPRVWNPATGAHTPVDLAAGTFNLFCSGLAHLVDGRVFLAGGNKNSEPPWDRADARLRRRDPTAGPRTADMAFERWYPSVTPLANGEMLITEGGPDIPEVRGSATARSGTLDAACELHLPLYPWLDVAPDGRAFNSGPEQDDAQRSTPSGAGAWLARAARDTRQPQLRQPGASTTSASSSSPAAAPRRDARGHRPQRQLRRQATPTGSMAIGRRQHNLTVLADGTVLATGGNSSGARPRRPRPRRLRRRALEPGHRAVDDARRACRQTRQYHSTATAAARRPGPVRRAAASAGPATQVGYLAKNARGLLPALPVRRDRARRRRGRASRRRAGNVATGSTVLRGDARRPPRPQRRGRPARRRDPLRPTWSSATCRWRSPPGPRSLPVDRLRRSRPSHRPDRTCCSSSTTRASVGRRADPVGGP